MAETPDQAAPSPRTPRWVKVLLVISLALNLAMVGMLGGAAFRHRHPGPETADVALAPVGLRLFGAALPEGARDALRRDLAERRGEMIEARRALRVELGALLAALRAEPFAPEAVADALSAQSEIAAGQIALGHEVLLVRVAALTSAERRVFADRIEAALRHARRPRDRD